MSFSREWKISSLLLLLAFCLLSSCTHKALQKEDDVCLIPTAELEEYIKNGMSEHNIPGLSIAILQDGEVCYQNSFGYANVEKKKPVTDATIFEGASISKPLFSFFVMTFVEEGKLDLDKPLFEYLPHPYVDPADEDYQLITARMVLSHRSGFPNWVEDEDDQVLRTKFTPGSQFLYSGEGYQYLAMVLMEIEQTDHFGLEQLFQERVAKPLGMEHTVFIQNRYTRKHKAEPYDEEGNWVDWTNNYWYLKEDNKFYAASSIHSSPHDFSKWLQALMNREILSPESYAELFKIHSKVPNDQFELSYTLGFLKPDFAESIYLHSGDNEGFTSWFALDIENKWGFVLFANSENGGAFGQEFFLHLLK